MISRRAIVVCTYAIGIGLGALLIIQHWVHVPQFLPYLLFAACPLIHLFMHGGHHAHRHREPKALTSDAKQKVS